MIHKVPGLNDLVTPINFNAPILKVHMIISSFNSLRAKDVYGMDTKFFKTYKEAFIPPIYIFLIGL